MIEVTVLPKEIDMIITNPPWNNWHKLEKWKSGVDNPTQLGCTNRSGKIKMSTPNSIHGKLVSHCNQIIYSIPMKFASDLSQIIIKFFLPLVF